jgi:hypothetical protein
MSYATIKGTIHAITNERTGDGKNGPWKSATVVISEFGNYPNFVPTQAMNEKLDLCLQLGVGANVTAEVRASGREYQEKWYADIKLNKIDALQSQNTPAAPATPPAPPAPAGEAIGTIKDGKIKTVEHDWQAATEEWITYIKSLGYPVVNSAPAHTPAPAPAFAPNTEDVAF